MTSAELSTTADILLLIHEYGIQFWTELQTTTVLLVTPSCYFLLTVLVFEAPSLSFLFLDRRRPLAQPGVVRLGVLPRCWWGASRNGVIQSLPPPCGRGTDRKLDGCLGGGRMQTARECAGRIEEEALGAGVRPGVSAGPPLPCGCRSLADNCSVAGTNSDYPGHNTFLKYSHFYQHLKSNYWFWRTKTLAVPKAGLGLEKNHCWSYFC